MRGSLARWKALERAKGNMNRTEFGDCREIMRKWVADGVRVQTCVTSPPYFGLRDYGVDGQLGAEKTPDEYVAAMVEVFRGVRDVLADDGTLWLNLGDSYARNPAKGTTGTPNGRNIPKMGYSGGAGIPSGLKEKDLIGVPWRVAFALQADGWYLRQDIIWAKPNPMPESVRDRCTKAHEYIFMLSKSPRYYYDREAASEPCTQSTIDRVNQANLENQVGSTRVQGKTNGNMKAVVRKQDETGNRQYTGFNERFFSKEAAPTRNRRSVWTVTTKPFKGAHFATFPPDLIEPCILAGSRPGDIVLDPFMGSGTTAGVALKHGRQYLGCELNPEYGLLHEARIAKIVGTLK